MKDEKFLKLVTLHSTAAPVPHVVKFCPWSTFLVSSVLLSFLNGCLLGSHDVFIFLTRVQFWSWYHNRLHSTGQEEAKEWNKLAYALSTDIEEPNVCRKRQILLFFAAVAHTAVPDCFQTGPASICVTPHNNLVCFHLRICFSARCFNLMETRALESIVAKMYQKVWLVEIYHSFLCMILFPKLIDLKLELSYIWKKLRCNPSIQNGLFTFGELL